MKHVKFIGVLSTLLIAAFAILTLGQTNAANTNTNTTMKIKTGVLSFYKDTGATMDTYFSHGPNTATVINIGDYDASLLATNAASSGDHRFTVSDLKGKTFAITLQSSALTADDGSGGTLTIPAANIGYTGTTRFGTGKALVAAPTVAADIWTTAVTFVSRTNNLGISKFSQEITIKVAIPAAQGPGDYTGLLTFTY